MTRIALATCSALPRLDDDERLVIPALAARGVTAEPQVWDDPTVDWPSYQAVVVRSTWDYAERRRDFLEWCARLPRVLNSLPVITWNTDKVYLRELAEAGIAVVPTTWFEPTEAHQERALPDGELVVKPAVSAGARDTTRHAPDRHAVARSRVGQLLAQGRTVMVQPYIEAVDCHGEIGLIYFAGEFSHAVRKGPILQSDEHVTRGLWAPEDISPCNAAADDRAAADATLDALPWSRHELAYARVDLVRAADASPMVLELELTEPSLFLAMGDGAAERFAAAIVTLLR
jgi:glutathione synthase/RimK-type ligase-like ATP-grasp enzyme